jgi:hypothetical protein
MLDTVEAETTWPVDKRCRWLGFVAGGLDAAAGPVTGAPWATCTSPLLQQPTPHDEPLQAALLTVMTGLPDPDDLRPLRRAVAAAVPMAHAAFLLGYLQALLVDRGLLDVTAERERTRPVFHRAYAACGWTPPASASPG